MCETIDSWLQTLAECKRHGHPFEHAWALALKRRPPPATHDLHWGADYHRFPKLDEPVLCFARRAFRAAYEDSGELMSALLDTDGMEAW